MFAFVCFYLQEKEGCHSSLYTLKWFMQCFLDRVCSVLQYCFIVVLICWCACIMFCQRSNFCKQNYVAWKHELLKGGMLLLKGSF